MSRIFKTPTESVRDVERSIVKRLRDLQSTQTFAGTLRIDLNKVYVDRKSGLRALDSLRHIRSDRLLKAK